KPAVLFWRHRLRLGELLSPLDSEAEWFEVFDRFIRLLVTDVLDLALLAVPLNRANPTLAQRRPVCAQTPTVNVDDVIKAMEGDSHFPFSGSRYRWPRRPPGPRRCGSSPSPPCCLERLGHSRLTTSARDRSHSANRPSSQQTEDSCRRRESTTDTCD